MSLLKPSPAVRQALVWVFSNIVSLAVLLGFVHPNYADIVVNYLVDGSFALLMLVTTYRYLKNLHIMELETYKKLLHHTKEVPDGRGE